MKIKGGYNCLLLHGLKCNKATSIPLEISRLDGQKQQRERQMGRGDIIMPNTLWLFLLENSTSLNYHRGIFTAEARKWNFSILLLRWWFLPWESMWLKIVWEIVTEKQRGCLEVVFFFWVVLYFLSRLLRSPNVKILQLFPLLTNCLYLNGPWTHLDFISALLLGQSHCHVFFWKNWWRPISFWISTPWAFSRSASHDHTATSLEVSSLYR